MNCDAQYYCFLGKRKRSRLRHSRIMWFYSPYDERVRTHVIQRIFAALELCYPWGHSLHKIFNRHTMNASYKTLANVSKQIAISSSSRNIMTHRKPLRPQPRVPFPPGPAQQQPAPPPVTRSMSAQATSLTPPTLATPALAPARASSTTLHLNALCEPMWSIPAYLI